MDRSEIDVLLLVRSLREAPQLGHDCSPFEIRTAGLKLFTSLVIKRDESNPASAIIKCQLRLEKFLRCLPSIHHATGGPDHLGFISIILAVLFQTFTQESMRTRPCVYHKHWVYVCSRRATEMH